MKVDKVGWPVVVVVVMVAVVVGASEAGGEGGRTLILSKGNRDRSAAPAVLLLVNIL